LVDLELISNNLQGEFEKSSYTITQGGFLGEIAFFNANKGDLSLDVIISAEDEEFPQNEESDDILNMFDLMNPKRIVSEFLIGTNITIDKSGILVEEYNLSQIIGYFFRVYEENELTQIQIFPGNFAIPIIFGQEPELPEISKPEYFEAFGESEILEGESSIFKDKSNDYIIPLKKPKKTGRNDPCPCGSGIKYKKCCGKLVN